METLPYKVIKTAKQYKEYCVILENLVASKKKTKGHLDAIDLLTLIVERWEADHNSFSEASPIEVLVYLMKENRLKAVDLAKEVGISKSLLSDVLHYRRGLSRIVIRKLAERFKVSQELFNRPYKLISPLNSHLKDASVIKTRGRVPKAV